MVLVLLDLSCPGPGGGVGSFGGSGVMDWCGGGFLLLLVWAVATTGGRLLHQGKPFLVLW